MNYMGRCNLAPPKAMNDAEMIREKTKRLM